MLTSVGCFGGSRAVRPVFELRRKTGTVAKKTDLRMRALNCIILYARKIAPFVQLGWLALAKRVAGSSDFNCNS